MSPSEAGFWEHVRKGTPPALDGSDASARFLAERFPNSVPQSEIALPEKAGKLLSRYRDEACRQLEKVAARKQEAENLLKEMLGSTPMGLGAAREQGCYLEKRTLRERLDTKTLKAEHPTLFKKYAKSNIVPPVCYQDRALPRRLRRWMPPI